MADTGKDAAKTASDEQVAKKGRAKTKKSEKSEKVEKVRKRKKAAVVVPAEVTKKAQADDIRTDDAETANDPWKPIREQIENCTEEIKESLRSSVSAELKGYVTHEIARVNRRRHWNNFFHDIVIILLAVVAVYFGYCLYDVHYFNFMKTECEKTDTCDKATDEDTAAGPIKDATWYLANYSYLFENIQTHINADNLEAYYLYTDDRKVSEMDPQYLLSMAYNRVSTTASSEPGKLIVTGDQMAQAFKETFGSTEFYRPTNFAYDCYNFVYTQDTNRYMSDISRCENTAKREIVEKIDRIYEEGEVIYIATVAAIRDKSTLGLYSFDNLFKPVTVGVETDDLGLYSGSLNRYQYQFKKNEDQYYLSGITKIK